MHKKIRFIVRFISAFLTKHKRPVFLGLLLGVLVFALGPKLISRIPFLRPTQKIGIVGKYTLTDLPPIVQSQISVGLTAVGPNGLASPALAKDWVATDGGKTYIFTLNDTYKWQDGSKVKSRDIKYNFRDASVDYPDDTHLTIKLPDAFAPLPVVVSKPILKQSGRSYVGLGSYKIEAYTRNGQTLDSLSLGPVGDDSLPHIKYYFFQSQSMARTALKLGTVSSIMDLSEVGDLKTWPNLTTSSQIKKDRFVAVLFDISSPDFQGMSGKNLRIALSYATNKDFSEYGTRAIGPISPDSWAFNPEIKAYEFDAVRAKQLLSKVEKLPDTITLTVMPSFLDVAEQIKKNWEAIGLKVNIQSSAEVPDQYQALIAAVAIPTDPDQYNLWHSTQAGTNITNLANPRIDKLLEDGRKILNSNERKKIYFDFQKYLLEEAPAIFLYYPHTYTFTKK